MRYSLSACALLCAGSLASADVLNGSFEGPTVIDRQNVNPDSWTRSNGTGLVLLEHAPNDVSKISAHTGVQFVSFGHNGASNVSLTQTFATVPGENYNVSFALACIQGDDFQEMTAAARVPGGGLIEFIFASVSSRSQGWVEFNFAFAAVGDSTELRFTDSTGSTAANIAIDSVVVTPAPSAAALLALAALPVLRRRR